MEGTEPTDNKEIDMSRYEMNTETQFHTSEETLEDGSKVYDVYFRTPYGQELIAEPPSEQTADELANALNRVRNGFLDCGSYREVHSLASALAAVMDRHEKKAA